jgi:hypothetical protein
MIGARVRSERTRSFLSAARPAASISVARKSPRSRSVLAGRRRKRCRFGWRRAGPFGSHNVLLPENRRLWPAEIAEPRATATASVCGRFATSSAVYCGERPVARALTKALPPDKPTASRIAAFLHHFSARLVRVGWCISGAVGFTVWRAIDGCTARRQGHGLCRTPHTARQLAAPLDVPPLAGRQ